MGRRGTTNTNDRGSSYDRRARREWLVEHFGDGTYVACVFCGCTLTVESVSPDRITLGIDGGRYTRDNVRPACADCQSRQGGHISSERRRARSEVL